MEHSEGVGSFQKLSVAGNQQPFLGGGLLEQTIVVYWLVESGVEAEHPQVFGELAEVIVANESHW